MWSINLPDSLTRLVCLLAGATIQAGRRLLLAAAAKIPALSRRLLRPATPKPDPGCGQLIAAALKQSQNDLVWAQKCFNSVTDSDLVDYFIYQMLAAECRYSYCLKLARRNARLVKTGTFNSNGCSIF